MATNLAIDDGLLDEALRVGGQDEEGHGHRGTDGVHRATRQQKILDSFGKVTFDRTYDYKAQRKRR